MGESIYSNDFKGFEQLMTNLQVDDPQLFQSVYPTFNNIRSKRKKALIIGGVTALGGTALSLSSLTSFYSDFDLEKQSNLIYTGLGVVTLGALITVIIFPKESDYLNLVNQFNRNSKNQKIEWDLSLYNPRPDQVGLTLSARF